jgi:predicted dehydrogenase
MWRVGLIGYGYWGPNLARNFNASPAFELVRIADTSKARQDLAKSAFPAVTTTDRAEAITEADDLDVVVIATPVKLHYPLARAALAAGKHVWVEKPMSATSAQCNELVELAEARGLTLIVDHTFLFTSAVRKMKELVETGELGELYYYDSVRVNLGLFQNDVNVIWDLAAHDLSIMDFLLGASAKAISAQGSCHFDTGLEDVAYLSVYYANNLLAHFHVNWLSPVKVRQTLVGGSKRMLLWDDLSADEKIKIYTKGVQITNNEERSKMLAQYRIGDMYCPALPNVEALRSEVEYFAECIRTKARPINDGRAGARIVSMLEAADKSLKNHGTLVEL